MKVQGARCERMKRRVKQIHNGRRRAGLIAGCCGCVCGGGRGCGVGSARLLRLCLWLWRRLASGEALHWASDEELA